MIYKTFFVFLCLVAALIAPAATDAFRAPENPTGLTGLKAPLVVAEKPSTTTTTTTENIITPATIEQVGKVVTAETTAARSAATIRKRWEIGIDDKAGASDNYVEDEYWYNPTIHTFGNVGVLGGLHAALAPIATKIIDQVAYGGQDVRSVVAQQLSRKYMACDIKADSTSKAKILDMCCGVGISTRALQNAFPDSDFVVGVDTSPEMVNMAGFLTKQLAFAKPVVDFFTSSNKSNTNTKMNMTTTRTRRFPTSRRAKFATGNAERTNFPSKSFDLVTIMYAFHEAPEAGREKILQEAYRVLQPGGMLAVVDISTEYTPSKTMLDGEPYVLEYQKNIHRQLRTIRGFSNLRYKNIVKDHVGMWTLIKRTN